MLGMLRDTRAPLGSARLASVGAPYSMMTGTDDVDVSS
jgi:hypothetical protein